MSPLTHEEKPIALKLLYIKLISLIDREANKDRPLFKRKLRRSAEEFPVYDSSLFYQFTQFGAERPTDHEWKFTSSRGQVDALQIHPFDPSTSDPDPAKRTIHKSVGGYLRPTPDTLLVTCHYYNAFQKKDGEWAGIRAANDTGLLRLVVDFSSVMTIGNEALFLEQPSVYWAHELERDPNDPNERLKTKLDFEFDDSKVFSVSQKSVLKRDVIFIKYKMNWDSLFRWEAYHDDERYIPEMLL